MSYHKIIGYYAFLTRGIVICDGEACVIAGSEEKMKDYMKTMKAKDASAYTIKKTSFGEIMQGFNMCAAYAFDEESYNKFYPLAQKEGLAIGAEDFSQKPVTGMHFVQIRRTE